MRKYAPRTVEVATGATLRPVFGIDIDGTIGKYHEHFRQFAAGYFGQEMPSVPYEGPESFYRYLGVSRGRYRRAKLAYRQGGLKRSMPVYDGMADVVAGLRRRGALVAICTTRPYLSLENIDEDTREWLRRNGIQRDAIVWGEHKYRDLVRLYGKDRVVAVVDDLPELLGQASGLGLDTVMMLRPHNANARMVSAKYTAWNARTLGDILNDLLDKWEGEHL